MAIDVSMSYTMVVTVYAIDNADVSRLKTAIQVFSEDLMKIAV